MASTISDQEDRQLGLLDLSKPILSCIVLSFASPCHHISNVVITIDHCTMAAPSKPKQVGVSAVPAFLDKRRPC